MEHGLTNSIALDHNEPDMPKQQRSAVPYFGFVIAIAMILLLAGTAKAAGFVAAPLTTQTQQ